MAKLLLSQTLKKPPEAFEFLPQKAGPPRVQCYATPLEGWLSISHTEAYVGVAYAPFAMGLDICGEAEAARLQRIAHRAFSAEEVALCWDFPEYLPALWALKEAALKMQGGGIFSPGLSSICIKGLFPPLFASPRAEARLYAYGEAFVALAFEGEAR
jgi:phosphopantetheinyl transferase